MIHGTIAYSLRQVKNCQHIFYVFVIEILESVFCKFMSMKTLTSLTYELMSSHSINSAKCLLHHRTHNDNLHEEGGPGVLLNQKESGFLHLPFLTWSHHFSSVVAPIGCFHNFCGQSNLILSLPSQKCVWLPSKISSGFKQVSIQNMDWLIIYEACTLSQC